MSRLLAIELENFQSIKRRQRIEFAPLTFFFGPNSAGKSAIFDALHILRLCFDKDGHEELLKCVRKWTNHDAKLGMGLAFEVDMIDLEKIDDDDPELFEKPELRNAISEIIADVPENITQEYVAPLKSQPVRFEVNLCILDRETDGHFINKEGIGYSLKIFYMGCCIVWTRSADFSEQIVLKNLNGEIRNVDFTHDDNTLSLLWDTYETWINIGTDDLFYFHDSENVFDKSEFSENKRDHSYGVIDFKFPFHEPALSGSRIYNLLIFTREVFYPVIKDFNFIVDGMRECFKPNTPAQIDLHIPPTSFMEKFSIDIVQSRKKMLQLGKEVNQIDLLGTVNTYLDNNLFVNSLYQVDTHIDCIVDLKEVMEGSVFSNDFIDGWIRKLIVEFYLKDSKNNKISISDVGQGINCVIPILYVAAQHNQFNSAIQQPELHLHPKLQCELADVLLTDLSDKSKTMIVETHSEHIILRLLKRINETTTKSDPVYPVTNDQVAVYYFDPKMDTGTQITRQYITPEGDFLFDWPNGFFGERNNELFYD